MVRKVDNFDLRGAFNYLVEDEDEGGMGLTRVQAENQIAQRLAKEIDFDYTAATDAGFNNEQIISKLTGIEQRGALSTIAEGFPRGAIQAVPAALTMKEGFKRGLQLGAKVPGPLPVRAASTLLGGVAGAVVLPVAASLVDQYVGLSKGVGDFLLGEEEPVLPSDQPFREAGRLTGSFLTFSGALRRGLAKTTFGDIPMDAGATLVGKSADFGSKKILANLRKYDPDAKVPLSLRALQGTENLATKMATRARGSKRDYYLKQEIPIAVGAGVGVGLAEQIDPGDAVTAFFSSLGGALVVPISPLSQIISGAAAKSAQAGRGLMHPVETLKSISFNLKNKAESKARNDLIKIYDELGKTLEAPGRARAAVDGVDYNPVIHSPEVDFTKISGQGAANLMQTGREVYGDLVPGVEELLAPGNIPINPNTPGFEAMLPVFRLQAEAMAKDPKLKELVSNATQTAVALGQKTLQSAVELKDPTLIAAHTESFQKAQEQFIGEFISNKFKGIAETLDKAEAKGTLEPGEGSKIIVREIDKLRNIAGDIGNRLYDAELIDYLAAVKPQNLVTTLNELENTAQLQGRLRPADIKSTEGKQILTLIDDVRSNIQKADPTLQRPVKTTVKKKVATGFKPTHTYDPKMQHYYYKGHIIIRPEESGGAWNIAHVSEGEPFDAGNGLADAKRMVDDWYDGGLNVFKGDEGKTTLAKMKARLAGENNPISRTAFAFPIYSNLERAELERAIAVAESIVDPSTIRIRKSTAIPAVLKPGKEPFVPRIRSLVKNIDPDFDGMSELVAAMGEDAIVSQGRGSYGQKIGREMLPSARMKRGGERDLDGLIERAIEAGYFPGGTTGTIGHDDILAAIEKNAIIPEGAVKLAEYESRVARADQFQRVLDDAGIKTKEIRGMTDNELANLVDDIESGMLPPREMREQVGGFPKDMSVKDRKRLIREQEKTAKLSADQIIYDPDMPLQVMTVGDAIRIRSLVGERVRELAKDDKGRSEQRILKLLDKAILKDLSDPALTGPAEALVIANTFTKAKNDVFSRTLGGEMANKLKYSDPNVFTENLLSAGRPNELGNRITGLQKFGSFFEEQANALKNVDDPALTELIEKTIPVSQNSAKTIENSMVEVIRGMLINGVIEPKPQSTLVPRDIKQALPGEFDADQLVVNTTKLKTFTNKYKVAADQNPMIKELFDDMSDPVAAQQILAGLKSGKGIPEENIPTMLERIAEKNALSDILGVDSPTYAITQILESREPLTKLNNLIKQVNRMKTSNIPVMYEGRKVPAKEVYEPAVNGLMNSFIQVAREASYVPKKEIYGAGAEPISYYDAKIFRQVFFETGEVFPAMQDLPPLADTLLKQGIINKAKYKQIKDVTESMERMQNQQMFMERLPAMAEQPPNVLKRFGMRFFGAQVGSRLGTMAGGRGTIQIPGFAAGVAEDLMSKAPSTFFISYMGELFQPGGYTKLEEMLEATAEETIRKQKGAGFSRTPLLDSPLAIAAPVEAVTRDREEKREITPPPPVQPISQASPSVNPMQTNQRARYAAMFPFDPASAVVRERQAQGIGSLPRP